MNLLLYIQLPLINLYSMLNATYINNKHNKMIDKRMKKIAIARVLANTSEYLKESFENSVGTQLANMKTFKKFCLDLTTVALPNLIA